MSARRTPQQKISNNEFGDSSVAVPPASAPARPRGRPRITPRNSIVDGADAVDPKETPYNTLRQLANIISKPATPLARAPSAGPPSTHRSARRTPAVQDRTP